MQLKLSSKLILLAILLLAASFRFYNLNWDQGHHLHPDERAIIMKVVELRFPDSPSSFFTPSSPLNPRFFAYGNFPFYLLKFVGLIFGVFDPLFTGYDLINIAGRFTSAIFDLGTVILLFYLGKKLHSLTVGYLSAFFYASSVLPIQLAHFYAVDTLLTFFSLSLLYQLIRFYEKPNPVRAIALGIFFGLALSTKISALVLLTAIGTALIADFALIFIKQPHKPHLWLPHLPAFIKHLFNYALIIIFTTFVVFAVTEPYAIISFPEFLQQTLEQSQLTQNPFAFPYTLQYVGKIPYFYELKNIFLWGLGPILSTLSFIGIIYFLKLLTQKKRGAVAKDTIIAVFFFSYFVVVGKFAVGFMRYLLPLYPLFCLFASFLAFRFLKYIQHYIQNKFILTACYILFTALVLVWPLSFIHIYTRPNTRVTATQWINDYIPEGKSLAQEHWDDPVPLQGSAKYRILTLTLYDPDTPSKWQNISNLLAQTDYIIIASNRLYEPLQRLTDCKSLPQNRCYPQAAGYYRKLFNGTLGFQKIVEFQNYPTIPLLNIPINDQGADESFTVYDHPKIMIFQRINPSL